MSTNANIQRNAKGEVYGSEIFLNQMGIEPELILAEGNDRMHKCKLKEGY